MARTIAEIKKEITDDFIANEYVKEKYGLEDGKTFEEQFSKVSLESIIFYLHAFRVWLLETLFEKHIEEANEIVRNKRPHTLGWYRDTTLNFQFGKELSDDIAEYDNTDMTEEEIAAQKIITKCAVNKTESIKPTIQIKVAKENGALSDIEKAAFVDYMNKKADAGLLVHVITGEPDRLVLHINILYDGLVLNDRGEKLIGGKKPLVEITKNHLKNLIFNGTFYPSHLEQELMKEPGIKVATITTAQAAPAGQTPIEFIDAYEPLTGAISIVETDLISLYELF